MMHCSHTEPRRVTLLQLNAQTGGEVRREALAGRIRDVDVKVAKSALPGTPQFG